MSAIAGCVGKKPEKQADCVEKAGDKCRDRVPRIVAARAALTTKVTTSCEPPFPTLRAQSALNLAAIDCECDAVGVSPIDSLDDYAQCIVRQHECRLADLAGIATPRLNW